MVEIKFCGLTRPDDARAASRLGARYAGVIYAGGIRERPSAAAALVHDAASPALRAGVFGADYRKRIPAVTAIDRLDVVQLHADPTMDDIRVARSIFPGTVWAVLRIAGTDIPAHAAALFAEADAVVLDARIEGALGGTGHALDWRALAKSLSAVRGAGRLVLAGGLRAENVREAIEALSPSVVDVSSGVESSPGIKDHARMAAFAAAVGGTRT